MTIIFILLIVFAMFVQSLTGFGGALVAMPISIMLLGVDVSRPSIMILTTITALCVAIPNYRDINWKKLAIMTIVMLAGVIAGDFFFSTVSAKPLLIVYGIIVFLIGLKKLLLPNILKIPVWGQYAALCAAGIMQGLFISGGSFLVIYAVEQLKNKKEFRATVSAVWVPLNIYLAIKYAVCGIFTIPVLKITAFAVIPELIAIWAAGRIANKLKQETFLKITYIILIMSGVALAANYLL